MHALNLYLGALAAHDLSPSAGAVLAKARECAQTMDALFRALLDMSRLDASVVPAHREDFPIANVLDLLRLEFEPQAHAKGLQLRVVPSSAVVHTDPALTARILANLVSNAVRYTRTGRIVVGCRRTAGGVRIEVHDTGPGIPPEQQEVVFEEFYQVDNPGRDRSQGLGLGLAIVKRLALLLEAPLTLRSTPGRGSCFAIDLPAAKAVASADVAALPPPGAQVDLAGALVFVIDDEATILHATGTLLRRWGCEVAVAESGAEALRLASEATRVPDAILCDYRLARHETGVEVIATLRSEFNADIPALLVTGDTAPAQIQRVQASGLPVLHKPLQEHEVRAALGALVAAGRARKP
jgi:CheY-like chemotaxis protein